jgi:hypothetical protein
VFLPALHMIASGQIRPGVTSNKLITSNCKLTGIEIMTVDFQHKGNLVNISVEWKIPKSFSTE